MTEYRPFVDEPTLAETLDDPIVQQVMLSDGVSRGELLRLAALLRHAHRRPSQQPEALRPH